MLYMTTELDNLWNKFCLEMGILFDIGIETHIVVGDFIAKIRVNYRSFSG